MKKKVMFVLMLTVVLVFGTQVLSAETLVDTVVKGCKTELETYCKNVTPGGGRLMACIDKNEKQVSDRCKQAMKDVGLKK
jgi:hypothetical protein